MPLSRVNFGYVILFRKYKHDISHSKKLKYLCFYTEHKFGYKNFVLGVFLCVFIRGPPPIN